MGVGRTDEFEVGVSRHLDIVGRLAEEHPSVAGRLVDE
jgi:hypothetical protein